MRERFVLIWFAILLILIPVQPVLSAEPEMVKLAEGVYGFIGKEGATNSGFVVTDEGVIVIDTQGPKELALLLKKKIQEITDKPLLYVINTHYHGDHTFGNQYFREAKEIIAHENTRKNLIEKDEDHREQFKRFFGEKALEGFELTLPTRIIKETFLLWAGGKKMEVAYLGRGHTDGDMIVYLPVERVLFGGDLLYKDRLPWLGDAYIPEWIETLDRLKNFDAGICVPGHGSIGDKDAISDFQQYLVDLKAEVKRYIEEGKGVEEIKKEISLPQYQHWSKYQEWLPLNAEKVYREITGK